MTFQVEVDYVDVVVTDQQGNFVRGLTRDDFALFEDGKPAKVDRFAGRAGRGGVRGEQSGGWL